MGVLLRIEWLKTVRRQAFWVVAGAFAAFTAAAAYWGILDARANASVSHLLPEIWPDIFGTATGLGPLLAGALMVLLVAPEFTWHTARQSVIDGLSKERFYAGKVVLLGGIVLLFLATTVLVGVGGALLGPGEVGFGMLGRSAMSYMGGAAACLLMVGSAGLMLAVLFRSSGPALGVLLLYLVLEEAVGAFMSQAGAAVQRATAYLPANILDQLRDDLAHYPELLAEVNAYRAGRGLAPLDFLAADALAAAALAYTAAFLAVAFLNMRGRDL